MGSIEWATWCLVIVTVALVFATGFYAYYTKNLVAASEEQTFVLRELTIAIRGLPSIAEAIGTVMARQKIQEIIKKEE